MSCRAFIIIWCCVSDCFIVYVHDLVMKGQRLIKEPACPSSLITFEPLNELPWNLVRSVSHQGIFFLFLCRRRFLVVSLRLFRFSCVGVISPLLHIHSCITWRRGRPTETCDERSLKIVRGISLSRPVYFVERKQLVSSVKTKLTTDNSDSSTAFQECDCGKR